MRKLFCSTVLATMSCAPGVHAHTIVPVRMVPTALIIPMPEPSSPLLLAVDLFAVGVLVFLLRRRISRTNR